MNIKNKNILVTGGAGFVGGHLVEELLVKKAHVVVVDSSFNKCSYLFTEKLNVRSTLVKQDMCDYKKTLALIKKYNIDFIFHLAAQAIVEDGNIAPKQTLDNNVQSTINILEATRIQRRVKGLIVASSDKAYGVLHKKKYKESDPLLGDSPYEVSKSITDLLCRSYYKTYNIPVVTTRFGNIYGEGDLHFSRIIPGIIKSLIRNEQFKIRSNGKYIRDYIYVKDVVKGYIVLACNIEKIKGEVFNLGSKDTLSVLQVIKKVEKQIGKKVSYTILNTAKNEIRYQSLDYSKIRRMFKWENKYTFNAVVQRIYKWYNEKLIFEK